MYGLSRWIFSNSKPDSFAHRRVWQSFCIASGPAESSVRLCWVWWGGGSCRWAVGRRDGRWCRKDTAYLSLEYGQVKPVAQDSSSPVLCSIILIFISFFWLHRFIFSAFPFFPFLSSVFTLLSFLSVSLNHPISCPRFRTFPDLVLFCFSLLWGWNRATCLTPAVISRDYCNTVWVQLCFHHLLYHFFSFFSLLLPAFSITVGWNRCSLTPFTDRKLIMLKLFILPSICDNTWVTVAWSLWQSFYDLLCWSRVNEREKVILIMLILL